MKDRLGMNSEIEPIDRSTLHDRVYDSLKRALMSGAFLPGETLTLRSLAKSTGTSAMPVRDAVKRLVAEKALIQTPDRVIRVVPYTPQTHAQHIRIRLQVEGFAAERACCSRNATLPDRLTEINQQMFQAAQGGNVDSMVAINQHFHLTLYEAANYPELLEMIEVLWLRTGPFVATARKRPDISGKMFERGVRAHQRIIDAIRIGDHKATRFALCLDIRAATIWLQSHYNSSPDPE